MSKLKGFLIVALVLFFVASNPSGAVAAARMLGSAISATANGFGAVFSGLAGGDQ